MDRQRIDKWLWHARVVRTRTAAAGLAAQGRIRINGSRIDAPSRAVRAGDVVTIALEPVRVLRVCGFSERRGSASEAALLFERVQIEEPREPGAETPVQPVAAARPDKRARREIVAVTRPGKR